MSDGQDSSVRAAAGATVSADSSSSAVSGQAVALVSRDSAGALVVFGLPTAVVPAGDGNTQVNTGNQKVQVNLDGSGKAQVNL